MADVVDKQTRSRMMSGIRAKNTKPELTMRRGLHRRGFRYRLHDPKMPGKPDMIFPGRRAIVMINGCFWHGHDCHLFKWPSSRPEWWRAKINRNREKDTENREALMQQGWRILTVWECALKGRTRWPEDTIIENAAQWLQNGAGNMELRGRDDGAN